MALVENTEAWVLRKGSRDQSSAGFLSKAIIKLPEIKDHDVMVEPLFGCWEGNMSHALARKPIDVCRLRREEEVVLGNAGVVRVIDIGKSVTTCKIGDICITVPIGTSDKNGHILRVMGYDHPGTVGVLAKRAVYHELNVEPIPMTTRFSWTRWAGFPIRFTTAWENWKMAYSVWNAQFEAGQVPKTHVFTWGGGTGLATVLLAIHAGCCGAMVASHQGRLDALNNMGITPIDRRSFPDLEFDKNRYETDKQYRIRHLQSAAAFMDSVNAITNGEGVSIFIDHLGTPLSKITLRALGRMGVIASAGWKLGKEIAYDRTTACVARHAFVHTHGCRRSEGANAVAFAERFGWLPPEDPPVYAWDDIPQLAAEYEQGRIESYFPVFAVNPI